MKFPKKLDKGACIGLVACSSFISKERLEACIAFLKESKRPMTGRVATLQQFPS